MQWVIRYKIGIGISNKRTSCLFVYIICQTGLASVSQYISRAFIGFDQGNLFRNFMAAIVTNNIIMVPFHFMRQTQTLC